MLNREIAIKTMSIIGDIGIFLIVAVVSIFVWIFLIKPLIPLIISQWLTAVLIIILIILLLKFTPRLPSESRRKEKSIEPYKLRIEERKKRGYDKFEYEEIFGVPLLESLRDLLSKVEYVPSLSEIASYFKKKGYETEQEKVLIGKSNLKHIVDVVGRKDNEIILVELIRHPVTSEDIKTFYERFRDLSDALKEETKLEIIYSNTISTEASKIAKEYDIILREISELYPS